MMDADIRDLRQLAADDPRLGPLVEIIITRVLGGAPPPVRRLGIADVERRVGMERSTIWREYNAGRFPAPEYLGERRVWRLDVLEAWERKQLARPRKPRLRGIAQRRAKAKIAAQGVAHGMP